MILQTGVIRLALLNVDGSKAKTLLLPPPSDEGLSIQWVKKASTEELLDGSPRTRLLGFLPVVTCRWNAYDERTGQGYTIGTADGQRPGLEDLLWFLSQPTGKLKLSPGLAAGGFVVDAVDVDPIGKRGGIFTGIQATFRARDTSPTMTLGAF